MKRILKNQNGGAAVEFAIIIPLLVLLFAGICDIGLLLYNQQVITNAGREGARAGIARADDNAVSQIVNTYCQDRLVTFGSAESPTTSLLYDIGKPFQTDFSVTVTYNYHFLLSTILNLGITKTLTAESLMKMEMELSV
jgi:Flp pilus assembly protein TadG